MNKAQEALFKFGNHLSHCASNRSKDSAQELAMAGECDCGFSEAYALLEAQRAEGDIEGLARYLNEISQTEIHFDNASKKIQDAYRNKARWIFEWFADHGIQPATDSSTAGGVDVGVLFKYHDADYTAFVEHRDVASFEASPAWKKIGPCYLTPPPRLAQAESGMGYKEWIPISSAPKDGTHILVSCHGSIPTAAHFFGGGWHLSVNLYSAFSALWFEPSHWQPLPEAPK